MTSRSRPGVGASPLLRRGRSTNPPGSIDQQRLRPMGGVGGGALDWGFPMTQGSSTAAVPKRNDDRLHSTLEQARVNPKQRPLFLENPELGQPLLDQALANPRIVNPAAWALTELRRELATVEPAPEAPGVDLAELEKRWSSGAPIDGLLRAQIAAAGGLSRLVR